MGFTGQESLFDTSLGVRYSFPLSVHLFQKNTSMATNVGIGITLVPESDQAVVTPEDEEAAVFGTDNSGARQRANRFRLVIGRLRDILDGEQEKVTNRQKFVGLY